MGLFNKKDVKNNYINDEIPKLEELPPLPELPQLPETNFKYNQERLHPLPNIPSTKIGNKFSQAAIKEAISDENFQNPELENFEEEKYPLKPQFKRLTKDIEEEIPYEFKEAIRKVRKAEPIYVRLDKFEDSLETFESMKQKIDEIKSLLKEIREKKTKEEQELQKWESELSAMKNQIEKIDREIFSKIE